MAVVRGAGFAVYRVRCRGVCEAAREVDRCAAIISPAPRFKLTKGGKEGMGVVDYMRVFWAEGGREEPRIDASSAGCHGRVDTSRSTPSSSDASTGCCARRGDLESDSKDGCEDAATGQFEREAQWEDRKRDGKMDAYSSARGPGLEIRHPITRRGSEKQGCRCSRSHSCDMRTIGIVLRVIGHRMLIGRGLKAVGGR